MRRIPYTQLLATLLVICLAGQTSVALTSAFAAATPSINKAELNKAVQEALAKQSGGAAGGQAAGAEGAAGLTGSAGAAAGAGAAGAGEGLGNSGSLSNLTEGSGGEEEAPAVTTAATNTASSGVSTSVLLPIFIVGAILLGGIAFFIVRDARSVAPVADTLGAGSAQERAARMRKRRAKAKAARRQRKRNR
jgi:hypothetical protein